MPHPIGGISEAEVKAKADAAWPEILEKATNWKPAKTELPPQKPPYPAETFKFKGTAESVSQLYFEKGWSLGLPINPPTPEAVEAMLKGTSRKPDEILGKVGPRDSNLTVELVAVNAVMAGCKPEYMPVLIAAIEGLLEPKANWNGLNTSTGSLGFLVIVNGPIAKEVGITAGQGAVGAEQYANATIGYAINLISDVVGGSRPGTGDMTTFGAPHEFVAWVFAENEDQLPKGWTPYHVGKGFKATDSVVTVMGVYPGVDHVDHGATTMDGYLAGWKTVRGGGGCFRSNGATITQAIVFGPELAKFAVEKGLDRDGFRQAFWEASKIPYSEIDACVPKSQVEPLFGAVGPDTLIPITDKPETLHFFVGGGAGKHSHIFTGFQADSIVSKLVTK
ncbi:MAG TPA: hypothetical protein PLJ35_15265 [Anaerolineae bacterium]|nr:hypothetical protein [Anaerolineae bacterium]HPL28755.1 hypothetical protein [Anaerolineae bacterium]